jgi:ribosomal protein S13
MSNYKDIQLVLNKVVSKVNLENDCNVTITFTDNSKLLIYHVQECCEKVRLDPKSTIEDLVEQYIDSLTIKIERKKVQSNYYFYI